MPSKSMTLVFLGASLLVIGLFTGVYVPTLRAGALAAIYSGGFICLGAGIVGAAIEWISH